MKIHALTSDRLSPSDQSDLVSLLTLAYEGDFSAEDFDHCLGGMHFLAEIDGKLVAHGAVIPRNIWVADELFRCGYLEAMGTLPELQGQGIGTEVLKAINLHIQTHYTIGALSTDEFGFYGAQGWQRWRGPSFVKADKSMVRSESEDTSIMVYQYEGAVDLAIAVESRSGDAW